ncbi:MAG: DegV family protein [Oscillospiraceae bacterium]|jgi:DegV family protein with EDD domain|nr:DegV family protein [Bacillota bacterium]
MSFAIFSDPSCNLPRAQLEEFQVQIIPASYEREGKLIPCPRYPEEFDGREYYNYLRNKGVVKTSLIPAGQMEDAFRPVLAGGKDVLYITLSSGISGTVAAGFQAAQALAEEFPERQVRVLDSMGAGFGIGLLLGRASDYQKAGLSLAETYTLVERDRDNLCEFFTVDDLMFLRRTGRLSGVTATLGTMLQLKPLLRGDESGHITVFNKVRGRKRAVETLAGLYRKRVCRPETQRVYISHGDCPEEAEQLAQMVRDIAQPKELIVCLHEPLTGAHVGPGMLALFFLSEGR